MSKRVKTERLSRKGAQKISPFLCDYVLFTTTPLEDFHKERIIRLVADRRVGQPPETAEILQKISVQVLSDGFNNVYEPLEKLRSILNLPQEQLVALIRVYWPSDSFEETIDLWKRSNELDWCPKKYQPNRKTDFRTGNDAPHFPRYTNASLQPHTRVAGKRSILADRRDR